MKERPASVGTATAPAPLVVVIEDDTSLREALGSLFRSVGLDVRLFESAKAFLDSPFIESAGCLVLDVRLPGVSGLEFQTQLNATNRRLPIVFMTGHGDVPMSVRAMKAGATDFLTKPFRDQDMLDAVTDALRNDGVRRQNEQALTSLQTRLTTLTTRELEVMKLVTAGLLNKQIAARLDRSEITVKMHRGQVMQKMQAHSLADLVRMAEALGIAP